MSHMHTNAHSNTYKIKTCFKPENPSNRTGAEKIGNFSGTQNKNFIWTMVNVSDLKNQEQKKNNSIVCH